jgi:hypothetical protein
MSEVKVPTAGRIVHYFHNKCDSQCENSFAAYLPAIVTECTDLAPSLSVMTLREDSPVVLRLSVSHKDTNKDFEGNTIGAYWDWPEIK